MKIHYTVFNDALTKIPLIKEYEDKEGKVVDN